MKKISINVTKAQILSFNVTLGEDKPSVSASIGLFTEGGRQISEYSISTDAWNDDKKFNLPVSMIVPIMAIMEQLEGIVVKHCNNNQLQLEGKK